MNITKNFFIALKQITIGSKKYYCWLAFLSFFILLGLSAYFDQLNRGLITTAMRDQVSWGLYISNFTFLVGVAAAAVYLVIPAYVYNFKPIKEIALFGEMVAITAITMCILFIIVDMGQPARVWHLLPVIGAMNFPSSLLAWDVIVLNGYLILNVVIVFYVLHRISHGKEYMSVVWPLIIISIPLAVSIHTVTAFLYNGLPSRPFWNASIMAPRFLASAFCSGPAIMLIIFQIARKIWDLDIENRAIFKIAELVAYAIAVNLFLLGAEVFKEFYSGSIHSYPIRYLYFGLHGKIGFVPWIWTATILNISAFFLFLLPKTRENFLTLNMGCVFIIIGVYIEKGMGLVVPGFIPDTLGEVYEYIPTMQEIIVTIGIWAAGALLYTLLLKFTIPVYTGKVRFWRKAMVVRDIMTRKLITVTPDATVEEVGKLLISKRISGVPVVDKDNKVIGVVSESDIIFKGVAEKDESAGNNALDIMTSPAITAPEDTPIEEMIKTITEKKIKRIIIVDKEGHPVGIVSRADILKTLESKPR